MLKLRRSHDRLIFNMGIPGSLRRRIINGHAIDFWINIFLSWADLTPSAELRLCRKTREDKKRVLNNTTTHMQLRIDKWKIDLYYHGGFKQLYISGLVDFQPSGTETNGFQ